ncbi:MAG: heme-binding protein [Planctomycetes bacterium]|nr:heme-binding protein [Planctomycetota bacterium]
MISPLHVVARPRRSSRPFGHLAAGFALALAMPLAAQHQASPRAVAADALLRLVEHADSAAGLRDSLPSIAADLGASPRARARVLLLAADAWLDRDALERRLEELAEDLRFTPYLQAPMPEGFPSPAPIDEVVVKEYPEYRLARTPMRSAGATGTPFFALFRHIQRHEIPMTAPVQVEFDAADPRARRTTSMAFLYETRELGPAGPDAADERVEVVDLPAMTTVTIGARGYDSPARIAELRAVLEAWLAAQGGRYAPAGPLRTMGYNSPMVPAPRRFFEVELPITRVEGEPVVAK